MKINYEVTTRKMPKQSIAFLAIGLAFIASGLSGQKAFIAIGIVFLVLALLRIRRKRG
ncbi:MAG: hypothetical protein ACR2G5_02475 [Pyrinomonadaceae bacterium]